MYSRISDEHERIRTTRQVLDAEEASLDDLQDTVYILEKNVQMWLWFKVHCKEQKVFRPVVYNPCETTMIIFCPDLENVVYVSGSYFSIVINAEMKHFDRVWNYDFNVAVKSIDMIQSRKDDLRQILSQLHELDEKFDIFLQSRQMIMSDDYYDQFMRIHYLADVCLRSQLPIFMKNQLKWSV